MTTKSDVESMLRTIHKLIRTILPDSYRITITAEPGNIQMTEQKNCVVIINQPDKTNQ